jgi:hypothetical protein
MRRVVQLNVVVILTLLCIFMKGFNFSTLEVVTDDELLNLVRTEKYVVVLFSKYPTMVRSCLYVAHMYCKTAYLQNKSNDVQVHVSGW